MLQRPNGSDLIQLYSAATRLSGAERYTSEGPAVAGGSPALQQVDYILITAGLASLDVTVQIVHDNVSLNAPLVVRLGRQRWGKERSNWVKKKEKQLEVRQYVFSEVHHFFLVGPEISVSCPGFSILGSLPHNSTLFGSQPTAFQN